MTADPLFPEATKPPKKKKGNREKGKRPPRIRTPQGNYVAEWFGHRVWPVVDRSEEARRHQAQRACPFLSQATGEHTECIKKAKGWDEPYGVCTINSTSNGTPQDWIACPYRTLDQHFTLLASAVRTSYAVDDQVQIALLPLTVLHKLEQRERIRDLLARGGRVFLFSSQKLGGEIDLSETPASPGALVDTSVVEVSAVDASGAPSTFGRHLFYEIQTADFHGSPLHVATRLKALCPRVESGTEPPEDYHGPLLQAMERGENVCGDKVEGPNKANIFKRTIYQMIFKMALARHPESEGFAIVLPVAVWESWLRHLGQPRLLPVGGDPDHVALLAPDERVETVAATNNAAVFVFEIDTTSAESPHPLRLVKRVTCSVDALIHHTFRAASGKAMEHNVVEGFRKQLMDRVRKGSLNQLQPEVKTKRLPRASPTSVDTAVPSIHATRTETASGTVYSETPEDA
ncbi:PDDEXK family nuclease [Deinococcus aquaedulcis]|uniref:NotI family restriction endonuclease n=1 Tax=Deinococcus aquaedulcis TaxID=2840455 RepID=UPI001C83BA33|nr:NotI family restriction endonuclease [Deinococcus aquaedulcis]